MAGKRNISLRQLSLRQLSFPFEHGKPDIEKHLSGKLGTNVQIVYTDNSRTMINSRRGANGLLVVRLHHMFRNANGPIVEAISEFIKNRNRESSDLLSKYIRDNHDLVRRGTRRRQPNIETNGQFHDLKKYFIAINERYFENRFSDVAITWGHRTRRRGHNHIRLGSYSFEHRLIRIHPGLDKKWVPRYYVESVIFHEMLHADFGVRSKNGRCQFHTGAFRQSEESFLHHQKAREWERKYIRKLL